MYTDGASQVRKDYGAISGYNDPKEQLVGSHMLLGSSNGGFVRNVIGDVIFHGKKKYWEAGTNYHYHHLLKAGESTLEVSLMRRAMVVLTSTMGIYKPDELLADYVKFMTTKDSHNDTYCGMSHRVFFANWKVGISCFNRIFHLPS